MVMALWLSESLYKKYLRGQITHHQLENKTTKAFCFFIIILVVLGFIFSFNSETDEVKYYKYKVAVDDNVSFNEFNEKYEVLSSNGKIYTVKEKELGGE